MVLTCAWHDTLADLLVETPEAKTPRYWTERQRQQGKVIPRNRVPEACLLQAGKDEAEPMYVADSEPTIWKWGGGRADVVDRDLISGELNRCEAG